MSNRISSDLIAEIREYQKIHFELLKNSHHFVFDCPMNFDVSADPEYVWMGFHPGDDEDDWEKTQGINDEETRDRDFQEIFGRSKGSKTRKTKIRNFLGQDVYNKTSYTELFFWCASRSPRDFQNRYGTSLIDSPHLKFCLDQNYKLIHKINPKMIFLEGLSKIKFLDIRFSLQMVARHSVEDRVVDEYLVDEKFRLLNFDHLSSGPPASLARAEVGKLVRGLLE
ncbi:hypothetical protein [Thalassospira marina]|uniref:Uncharacterized protein n=1 Tax=Thalassospira marina TaxID=2048283 RepID=A0ABN5FHD6_9PROT|nr:hypothetical protein [Thalassospira marina]AUG53369.1 hypothetical protein CSC3H3_12080 [Thalassospira marina]